MGSTSIARPEGPPRTHRGPAALTRCISSHVGNARRGRLLRKMQARGLSASLRPVQQAAQQGRSHRRVAAISLARSGAAGATAKLLSLGGYGSLQQRFHAPLRAQRPVAARPLREPARLGRVAVASSAASVNASDAGKKVSFGRVLLPTKPRAA